MASSKSSLQDQYFEILRNGQEAMSSAMEEWAKSAKDAWGSRPDASVPAFATLDPVEAVDQAFAFASEALQAQRRLLDFSTEILETQRQFAKTIAAATTTTTTAATTAAKAATTGK
jgi:hypothetical protein